MKRIKIFIEVMIAKIMNFTIYKGIAECPYCGQLNDEKVQNYCNNCERPLHVEEENQ